MPRSLAIPERLRNNDFHGGLPVPYIAIWDNGVPRFSLNDPRKKIEVITENLCGQCGQALNRKRIAFVMMPDERQEMLVPEPGMHVECANFAANACPYLSRRSYQVRGARLPAELEAQIPQEFQLDSQPRPERIVIYVTDSFEVINIKGLVFLRPGRPIRVMTIRGR